jgi:hypothetical protein
MHIVSGPAGSSPGSLVVPAGQGTQALLWTNSFSPQVAPAVSSVVEPGVVPPVGSVLVALELPVEVAPSVALLPLVAVAVAVAVGSPVPADVELGLSVAESDSELDSVAAEPSSPQPTEAASSAAPSTHKNG